MLLITLTVGVDDTQLRGVNAAGVTNVKLEVWAIEGRFDAVAIIVNLSGASRGLAVVTDVALQVWAVEGWFDTVAISVNLPGASGGLAVVTNISLLVWAVKRRIGVNAITILVNFTKLSG